MAITLQAEKPFEPRRETLHKAYNLLFNEKIKARMLVLLQLHRKEACSWNEIYEGSGLRDLGVSTSTVSRTLRELEEEGVVIKEKAPFPVKVKYRLVKPLEEFENLVNFENMLKKAEGEGIQRLTLETLREGAPLIFWMISEAIKRGDAEKTAMHSFILLHTLLHLAANIPKAKP